MSSELPSILSATEEDIQLLLAAQCHVGIKNCDKQMEPYVWKRRQDGAFALVSVLLVLSHDRIFFSVQVSHIINIGRTWEKLVFAARIIAAIENPNDDVCVISARPYGHRAVLKYAANTGAQAIAGRFTPGSFTNYIITRSIEEPRLTIVTDPRVDHQAIREASSYVNIPVIALAGHGPTSRVRRRCGSRRTTSRVMRSASFGWLPCARGAPPPRDHSSHPRWLERHGRYVLLPRP